MRFQLVNDDQNLLVSLSLVQFFHFCLHFHIKLPKERFYMRQTSKQAKEIIRSRMNEELMLQET